MNNLVSIIVPLYNKEQYIKKCIVSLINQTYSNLEIIIINDGSTDNSLEIVENIKDPRIKIFTIKNGGVSNARNFGIKQANGDYLMFVDSDDYVSKEYVESFVSELTLEVDYIASGRKDVFNNKIIDVGLVNYIGDTKSIPEKFYIDGFCHAVWGKLFKRDIIINNSIEFPKINISEDSFFNIGYLKKCKNVKLIDSCNYYYVHYEMNSLTSIAKYSYFEIYGKLFDEYVLYFSDKDYDYSNQILYPQFYNLIFKTIKSDSIKNIKMNDILNKVHKNYIVEIFKSVKAFRFEKLIKHLMIRKRWGIIKIWIKLKNI